MSARQWWGVLLVPLFLVPAVAIIAFWAGESQPERTAPAASPDFPGFVYRTPKVELGYRLAVEHGPLFAVMPCYCGCGVMPENPHRSLRDCFLTADGSFDSHASGCELCLDIAVDAVQWQSEGSSLAQVRSLVDAKYQDYGLPTNTDPIIE